MNHEELVFESYLKFMQKKNRHSSSTLVYAKVKQKRNNNTVNDAFEKRRANSLPYESIHYFLPSSL